MHLKNLRNTGTKPCSVTIIGRGTMLGEEDAAKMRLHTTTVRCESQRAEVIEMSIIDFHTRVKPNEDTWSYILRN